MKNVPRILIEKIDNMLEKVNDAGRETEALKNYAKWNLENSKVCKKVINSFDMINYRLEMNKEKNQRTWREVNMIFANLKSKRKKNEKDATKYQRTVRKVEKL